MLYASEILQYEVAVSETSHFLRQSFSSSYCLQGWYGQGQSEAWFQLNSDDYLSPDM